MVLFPQELKISKSMTKILKKHTFKITENQAFEEVINQCKNINRHDNLGTWITDDMEQAYIKLHKKGYAKSIEIWSLDYNSDVLGKNKKNLVGGLYGLDCQVYNNHLASLGAREILRDDFLQKIKCIG